MTRAVVLMYHRIGQKTPPVREPGEEVYAVSEEVFASQLMVLGQSGCGVLPVDELAARASDGRPFPDRALGITFDDGHASDYDCAFPCLGRLGLAATSFVTPAWLGTEGYLRWDELKELVAGGMAVGAHGLDHTPLCSLAERPLRLHLREARRLLEARLGRPPLGLALPGGAGGRREVAVARDVGFAYVFGSRPLRLGPGLSHEPLPRFAIRRGDSLADFRALVQQRQSALLRHSMRHRLAHGLRAALGEQLYARVRRGLLDGLTGQG